MVTMDNRFIHATCDKIRLNKTTDKICTLGPNVCSLRHLKLFFVCSYECNGTKLETAYKQGPKTGLKKNISKGKERELDNVQFLRSSSPLKEILAPLGGSKAGYCYLSIEILNILYDRHGPNAGFWCLMSFEHLNSKT